MIWATNRQMACSEWFEMVSAGADDQLSEEESSRLHDHMDTCQQCTELFETFAIEHRRLRFRAPTDHDPLVTNLLQERQTDRSTSLLGFKARTLVGAVGVIAAVGALVSAIHFAQQSTPASSPKLDAAVRIDARKHTFDNSEVTVTSGQSVEWRNSGELTHHIVRTGEDGASDTVLAPGHSDPATFTQPGVYRFWCMIHEGMQGTVTVDL